MTAANRAVSRRACHSATAATGSVTHANGCLRVVATTAATATSRASAAGTGREQASTSQASSGMLTQRTAASGTGLDTQVVSTPSSSGARNAAPKRSDGSTEAAGRVTSRASARMPGAAAARYSTPFATTHGLSANGPTPQAATQKK